MLRVAHMRATSSSRDTTSLTGAATPSRAAPWWRGLALSLMVAIVLGLTLGVWQAHADRLLVRVHPLLMALGGAGYVGLVAGLTTDIVWRARPRLLRLLVALGMILVWMGTGALSANLAGAASLHAVTGTDHWLEIGQVTIGALAVIVAHIVCQAVRRGLPPPVLEVTWVWESGRPRTRPWKASLLWRGLVPGLILAIPLGLGVGLSQVYAYLLPVSVPTLALALTGAGLMGLLLGWWCRWLLRTRVRTLRFAIAWLTLAAGAVVSQGVYVLLRGQNPLLGYALSEAFWLVVGQLLVGGLCIVGASLVWQRQPTRPLAPRMPAPPPTTRPAPAQPVIAPLPRPDARVRRGPRFRLPPLRLPARSRARNRFKTRVIAAEEDRCPYCLDLVVADDPRGVVTCAVCGTPHHGDCWAAAGNKCQVPHLNV